MSDNNLLLSISGDEDVDYTAPKTPSYSPSTDIEEHMDKQNDAYEDKTSRDLAFTTSAFPSFYSSHIFKFSPRNRTPRNFKTALCADAVM